MISPFFPQFVNYLYVKNNLQNKSAPLIGQKITFTVFSHNTSAADAHSSRGSSSKLPRKVPRSSTKTAAESAADGVPNAGKLV